MSLIACMSQKDKDFVSIEELSKIVQDLTLENERLRAEIDFFKDLIKIKDNTAAAFEQLSHELIDSNQNLNTNIQDFTNENQILRQNLEITKSFCEQYETQVTHLKSRIDSMGKQVEVQSQLLETYRREQS